MTVFTGNANPQLARQIVQHLGLPLGNASVNQFSDGEVQVEINENVRGKDVFIIQPTCTPTNDSIMELLVLSDALRRSSANRITAVMPYYGYSRQDRRPRSARVPISAKVVANMIASVGIDRVMTLDLHADQIQGFFDFPVDNIYATPIFLNDILSQNHDNLVVVSPDIGGVLRARATAKRVDAKLAIIDKRRPRPNESEVMNIIGDDISGCNCVIVDDIVDTAGTLGNAASALKERGAKTVTAYCTHAVLSGNAVNNVKNSGLDELVVADSIPLREDAKKCEKIRVLSIAGLVAESIRRIHVEESISSLFVD
ncbi:ribose-phosphate pyrophosphokinase [Suttonella sp. R2A3]|uniref:ribose-phosphate pyrophosphokinase n=1 Tax=Suttonella sp. R2A3 TaxID=2908648 RepID=UPI001F29AD5D|nr:ribose-phosphate pyrophosphokinase [Suttonella sp. R2A3]UJF23939.1 ribose-phosphate pyrophosphokinase [Suttonella sp. R2A3]